MALFKITVKQNANANGVRLQKGMSVQVASKYASNPMAVNGGIEVQEAFIRTYGIDLKKYSGGSVSATIHLMEVVKI